jgi:hypothetical protein
MEELGFFRCGDDDEDDDEDEESKGSKMLHCKHNVNGREWLKMQMQMQRRKMIQ